MTGLCRFSTSDDASATELDIAFGTTLLQAALIEGLPGIQGDCGGACQCATCHVYVDDAWVDRLPPVDDAEDAMLDCTASPRAPGSRLACRIVMAPELAGLQVRVAPSQ